MQRQFSNQIKIKFLFNDHSNTIEHCTDNDVVYNETAETKPDGVLYKQTLSCVISIGNKEALKGCVYNTVVTLCDGDKEYVWGNDDVPVKMTVTPKLNCFHLEFKRLGSNSLLSPVL